MLIVSMSIAHCDKEEMKIRCVQITAFSKLMQVKNTQNIKKLDIKMIKATE